MRSSRISPAGLLGRQLRADLGPLLAIAAIVLVASTLVTAAPLGLGSIAAEEIDHQVGSLPASRRALVGHAPVPPEVTGGERVFLRFERSLVDVGESAPLPLGEALGDPVIVASSPRLDTGRLDTGRLDTGRSDEAPGEVPADPETPLTPITLTAAPHIADHIRIVEGSPPRPFEAFPEPDAGAIDVLLSAASAERAEWALGESRRLASGVAVRLSGTFEAIDPGEDYWGIATDVLEPVVSYFPFGGPPNPIVTSAAIVDADSWHAVTEAYPVGGSTTVGFPFTASGLTAGEVAALLPQLRGFQSTAHAVKSFRSDLADPGFSFRTDVDAALETGLERSAIASAVVAMVASGPVGVALAALWLLSRLVALRRRDAVELAAARGASGWRLRLTIGLECLLLSLPAAALGCALGYLLVPARLGAEPFVLAGTVALMPPLLLALTATPRRARDGRSDLGPRASVRGRWILEFAVLGATALAVLLLLRRGLTTSATSVGTDPLLAATPLLLAVTAGLVILRLYPLPLLAVARAARRGRGIVGFLGALRGIREPAAGLAPVLAMVVGVTVAVFSAVLAGTMATGVETSARSSIGADLRLDSTILSEEQLTAIERTAGVEEAVPLYQYNRLLDLAVEDEDLKVPVIVVDTAALARVQAGFPGVAHIDVDMAATIDGRVPVLLSPEAAGRYSIGERSTLGEADIVSAGEPGTSPSLSSTHLWALVDRANSAELGIDRFLPQRTLLRLAPGADAERVSDALLAIAGPGSSAQTPADAAQTLLRSPASVGLQLALAAILAITALLCAATLLLALLLAGPGRRRVLALLTVLGLRREQARGVTAWELGPSAVIALGAGCALGLVLPGIVLAGVDLRPFTGGSLQPAVTIDPGLLGLLLGGFVVLTVVASLVALAVARRTDPTRILRTFEEG